MQTYTDFNRYKHREKGFSLVSVVITTALSSFFLAAALSFILPLNRIVSSSPNETLMAVAAESAVDYTVALLNDYKSNVDCEPIYGSVRKLNDTVILNPSMFGLPENATVEVWIKNVAPLPLAEGSSDRSLSFEPLLSPVYDPRFPSDPNLPNELKQSKENWSLFRAVGQNFWRAIKCKVKIANSEKILLATLKPTIGNFTDSLGDSSTPVSVFSSNYGFGLNSVNLGISSSTSGFDSSSNNIDVFKDTSYAPDDKLLGGDLSSFGKISLANSVVGGKLNVFDSNSLASVTNSGNGVVNQHLNMDASKVAQSGFEYNGLKDPSNSVLNASNDNFPKVNDTEVLGGSAPTTPNLSPSPSSSAQAASLPSVGQGGNYTLSSGDYVADSMQMSIGSSLSTSGTARIFLTDNPNVSNPLVVNGSLNSGGSPANLQIYYNGTGTLLLQGALSVKAVIYAPNANVQINGTSNAAKFNFEGAILARNIAGAFNESGQATGGAKFSDFKFDHSLANQSIAPSLFFNPDALRNKDKDVWTWKVRNVLSPLNPKDPKYAF